MLRGTIRDHVTLKRRAFVRFFACGEDLSHEPADAPVPDPWRGAPSPSSWLAPPRAVKPQEGRG